MHELAIAESVVETVTERLPGPGRAVLVPGPVVVVVPGPVVVVVPGPVLVLVPDSGTVGAAAGRAHLTPPGPRGS